MVLAALAIIVTGIVMEIPVAPTVPGIPADLDQFLLAVRTATSPTARVLVVGQPLVVFRAAFQLYPRSVYGPVTPEGGAMAPGPFWRDLEQQARRDDARYVLAWAQPAAPQGAVRVRGSVGVLVEVTP